MQQLFKYWKKHQLKDRCISIKSCNKRCILYISNLIPLNLTNFPIPVALVTNNSPSQSKTILVVKFPTILLRPHTNTVRDRRHYISCLPGACFDCAHELSFFNSWSIFYKDNDKEIHFPSSLCQWKYTEDKFHWSKVVNSS